MNVTGEQFKAYLERFHSVLEKTANDHLPKELASSLFHLPPQPCQVRGYVSTQFGVGFEYFPSLKGTEVIVGSRRIEGLFLGYPSKFDRFLDRRGPAIMIREPAHRISVENVTFRNEPSPFFLNGPNIDVTFKNCHFETLGWARDVAAAEINGNRLASFWTRELAVERAKDEILAALLEVNKATSRAIPIGEYVNSIKYKSVLVLGDYSPQGLERLQSICVCVQNLGYDPIIVKEVPDLFGADLQRKVSILGSLARFVLIDDSSPSGHLMEVQIAHANDWTTVLLHAFGKRGSWMTEGMDVKSKLFHEQDFDPENACAGIEKGVLWAEEQVKEINKKYKLIYPWNSSML